MKAKVVNWDNKSVGDIDLSPSIFELPNRKDILARMVRYQLAKLRSGTSKVKGRSEVALTGAKSVRQKGSGGARHHSRAATQFVGGGRAFGPIPRSYAHSLPKKVRALALKTALSVKASEGNLMVVDEVKTADSKTKNLKNKLKGLKIDSALVIAGKEVDKNFSLASNNVENLDVLPYQGLNVLDILRRKTLVLSKDAISNLEERFK